MIQIDDRFDVPAPPERVWAMLADPRAVVDCVPGASLGAEQDDGSFDADLTVKFGPIRVGFGARVALQLDAAAMEGRLTARGRDQQGATRIEANMRFRVAGQTAGSTVTMTGEVDISGKLAALIEGGATAVVKDMSREFASRLASKLTEEVGA